MVPCQCQPSTWCSVGDPSDSTWMEDVTEDISLSLAGQCWKKIHVQFHHLFTIFKSYIHSLPTNNHLLYPLHYLFWEPNQKTPRTFPAAASVVSWGFLKGQVSQPARRPVTQGDPETSDMSNGKGEYAWGGTLTCTTIYLLYMGYKGHMEEYLGNTLLPGTLPSHIFPLNMATTFLYSGQMKSLSHPWFSREKFANLIVEF